VYLGTGFADVNSATDPNTLPGRGRQDPNYYDVTGLVSGKTYYWRIDEVNLARSPYKWRGPIWSFSIPAITAYNPIPPDGFIYVAPKMILRWTKGLGAATHNVYFGTDETRVTDANNKPGVWPEFKGNQPGTTYDPPGALSYDKTYYWRVDEVNTTTYKGDVWDFTTVYAPIEPNLICLWKFDGDANDSSYGCDGTPYGSTESNEPNYVDGANGRAIYFRGTGGAAPNQYVDLPIGSVISTLTNSTFMAWVYRLPTTSQQGLRIFDFGTGTTNYLALRNFRGGEFQPPTNFEIASGGVTERVSWGPYDDTGTSIPANEWHHLAVTIDVNDADANFCTLTLYVDGVVPANGGQITNATLTPSDLGYTTQNCVARPQGLGGTTNALFRGYVDELRIYDRALTAPQIQTAMIPQKAWWPRPANGVRGVVRKPTLTWKAGLDANSVKGHRVYFDPDQQKVIARSGCVVNGVSTNNPLYSITTLLEPEWTYYWVVDEVNAFDPCSPWVGEVWSFTTRDYLVVEDFNSYADSTALRTVWKDYRVNGSRAEISLETDPNYKTDGNSMKYIYRNADSPFYAEAYAATTALPGEIDANWTIGDVEALVLYFYGQAGNDANEKMYVKLTDGTNTKSVIYDGDMNDIREQVWHEWNIKLALFAPVNLTNVTRITIGFGEAPSGSGEGTVYFEDIRLHPRRCVLSKRSADFAKADFISTGYPSGDCDVNYQELGAMVSNWLSAAELIWLEAENANTIKAPMQVYSDRADASGGEYIAVLPGISAPNKPDTNNPIIDINDPNIGLATYNFTVNGGTYKIWGRVIAPTSTQDSFWYRIPDANTQTTNNSNGWIWWDITDPAANWTWDELNSDNDLDATVRFTMSAGQHTLQIVHRERALLDLLVITDDLDLTAAGLQAWDADLNGNGKIDFKDFALLARQWLKEELWP
jgi:hypothetical protein